MRKNREAVINMVEIGARVSKVKEKAGVEFPIEGNIFIFSRTLYSRLKRETLIFKFSLNLNHKDHQF